VIKTVLGLAFSVPQESAQISPESGPRMLNLDATDAGLACCPVLSKSFVLFILPAFSKAKKVQNSEPKTCK
jgi:hypothetical protein